MYDPRKKRYLYMMLSGFGAISLSLILFFILYRLQGIGDALGKLSRILAPFIYGSVVAYLLRPLCNAFETFFREFLPGKAKKQAGFLSVFLSVLTGVLLVYALIDMIVPQLIVSISTLWVTLPDKVEQFVNWAMETFGEDERIVQFVNANYLNAIEEVNNWVKNTLVPQFSNIVSGVGMGLWSVLMFLYNLLVGLIVSVYLLSGRKRFARQCTLILRSLFSAKWANMILEEVSFIDKMFGGFIDAKILDSAIVGVICYIGCLIFRFPNALLISAIIGITNIIPFFGPFIGAVPATLLILMESPIKALWFIAFVLVLQQLDGNLIGPRIMGNRIGLSGLWVLFAIVFFSGLWGFVGMIVGVPVFAVIYDVVKKFVQRGLKQHKTSQLWDQYRADYPPEDQPDKNQQPEKKV